MSVVIMDKVSEDDTPRIPEDYTNAFQDIVIFTLRPNNAERHKLW